MEKRTTMWKHMKNISWQGTTKAMKIFMVIAEIIILFISAVMFTVFPPMAMKKIPLLGEEGFFNGFMEVTPVFSCMISTMFAMVGFDNILIKKPVKGVRFSKKTATYFLPFTESDYYWFTMKKWASAYLFISAFPAAGVLACLIFNGGIALDCYYGIALVIPAAIGLFSGISLVACQRIKNARLANLCFTAVCVFTFGLYMAFCFYTLFGLAQIAGDKIQAAFSVFNIFCSGWILLIYIMVPAVVFAVAWCLKGRKPKAWLNMEG